MQTFRPAPVPLLLILCAHSALCAFGARAAHAATAKPHTVTLGPAKRVPYTPVDAARPDHSPDKSGDALTLKVRPLFVDGRQREWTTGDTHDVTDRSFTVRRALRINDALPAETAAHWVWQPGPWLLVDRATGRITALHLPDFAPAVSEAVWFRDYAAYCGVAATAKGGLYAIVAQLGARRAVVSKQIAPWPQSGPQPGPQPVHAGSLCLPPVWQREPMRVTLQLAGGDPVTFDVVGSASIVEEGDGEEP